MRKKIAIALTAGVAAATLGIASGSVNAAPPAGQCGLENAHNKIIAGQGLKRHVDLQVHQVFLNKIPFCG